MRQTGLGFAGCSACWAIRQRWALDAMARIVDQQKRRQRGQSAGVRRYCFMRSRICCRQCRIWPRPTTHSERRPWRLSEVQPKQSGTSVSRPWQPKLTPSCPGKRASVATQKLLTALRLGLLSCIFAASERGECLGWQSAQRECSTSS